MPKKPRERFKDRFKAKTNAEPAAAPTTTLEILKRRRNKRFLFVAIIGISFPIFELIAYQYRAITLSFVNRSEVAIRSIKATYDGGSFELADIEPGGAAVQVIRPNFKFNSNEFSTYRMTIRISSADDQIISQIGRAGALDYSAQEIYTIESTPPKGNLQIQHSTRPGFPLGLVRDLMERLGFR